MNNFWKGRFKSYFSFCAWKQQLAKRKTTRKTHLLTREVFLNSFPIYHAIVTLSKTLLSLRGLILHSPFLTFICLRLFLIYNWIISPEQSLTSPELGKTWQLLKPSRDSGWDITQPFPRWVGVHECILLQYTVPTKPSNHYQLFSILCGREERSTDGKSDMKEDMVIPEQTDQCPGKTREQSVCVYPEDDKGIKQTAQIVWFWQKLMPDKSSVLFWQGNQLCGLRGKLYTWRTIVAHDILIHKL